MDFLSIRKKARERAAAKGAAAPDPRAGAEGGGEAGGERAEPAAPPAPPRAVANPPPRERRRRRAEEAAPSEADAAEAATRARLQELAPSADGRFSTWRPGSGPAPFEPEALGFEAEPPAEPPERPRFDRDAAPPVAPVRPPEATDPLDTFFYRPDEEGADVKVAGMGGEEPIAAAPEALEEYLTFGVGGEEYAVPIAHAREVMRAPGITEVPRAPAHVTGIVTVRGEIVAVIDARRRLGLEEEGAASRILIVDAGEGPLGLLVDEIANVVRLPRGSIEPCPQGIRAAAADCITGIGRHRDRLFMVVDVGALLGRDRQAREH